MGNKVIFLKQQKRKYNGRFYVLENNKQIQSSDFNFSLKISPKNMTLNLKPKNQTLSMKITFLVENK